MWRLQAIPTLDGLQILEGHEADHELGPVDRILVEILAMLFRASQCLGHDLQDVVEAVGQFLVLPHEFCDLLEVSVLADVFGDGAARAAGTARACNGKVLRKVIKNVKKSEKNKK